MVWDLAPSIRAQSFYFCKLCHLPQLPPQNFSEKQKSIANSLLSWKQNSKPQNLTLRIQRRRRRKNNPRFKYPSKIELEFRTQSHEHDKYLTPSLLLPQLPQSFYYSWRRSLVAVATATKRTWSLLSLQGQSSPTRFPETGHLSRNAIRRWD